ncbi:hypothetical protein BC938DRAFT_473021 [Jimgerdemannia flammicorona]|uniref:Uncharacterized protein n=1 Tax=Jimgerdemannia flammicorona TaxID=994334 RepID=A0A433Q4X8_9FUNG|nr:hypothetical protein BC938DRAFT_473021 [Jimgerdemannia flammicorona]
MDVSIRADDVIDLETAFDGDSFFAHSATSSLNLSSLTINDMDHDHDDEDDELNDELGIQPRFLATKNGIKNGRDWRRESLPLFKNLNEGHSDVSFDLLGSEMHEMFENPLLQDDVEPRSQTRPTTLHKMTAAPKSAGVVPIITHNTPIKPIQGPINLHPLDPSPSPSQLSTPKTSRYTSYFDQDSPQAVSVTASQQACTPTAKQLPLQRLRAPLHARTSPINIAPAEDEDVIFFGTPTAKERQASAKVHSMLGGVAATTPKTATPRKTSYRGEETHTPTSARHRRASGGMGLKLAGSLWSTAEEGREDEDEPSTPKASMFMPMSDGLSERGMADAISSSPTTIAPSRIALPSRRESLLGPGSPSPASPPGPPFLPRRNTYNGPVTPSGPTSPLAERPQFSSDTVAAAMDFMSRRTPIKPTGVPTSSPRLVRHSSDLTSTASPSVRQHNEKVAAAMQLATKVLTSPQRPRSLTFNPGELNLDLDLSSAAAFATSPAKTKARSKPIAVPAPSTPPRRTTAAFSAPNEVSFAALIPLPESVPATPEDPKSPLRRQSENFTAAMQSRTAMLERGKKEGAKKEGGTPNGVSEGGARARGESPMLIDLGTPVRERTLVRERASREEARTAMLERGKKEGAKKEGGTPNGVSEGGARARGESPMLIDLGTPVRERTLRGGEDGVVREEDESHGSGRGEWRAVAGEEGGGGGETKREGEWRGGNADEVEETVSTSTAQTQPAHTAHPASSLAGAFDLNFPSAHRTLNNSTALRSKTGISSTTSYPRRFTSDHTRDTDVDMVIDPPPPSRETRLFSSLLRRHSDRSTAFPTASTTTTGSPRRRSQTATRDGDGDTAMLVDESAVSRASVRLSLRRTSTREDGPVGAPTPRSATSTRASLLSRSSAASSSRFRPRSTYTQSRTGSVATTPVATALSKRRFEERNDLVDEDQDNGRIKMVQKEAEKAGMVGGTRLPPTPPATHARNRASVLTPGLVDGYVFAPEVAHTFQQHRPRIDHHRTLGAVDQAASA